ncbi:hypothetical protein Agub_g6089, partial [Astrephomene gubernaculifera]
MLSALLSSSLRRCDSHKRIIACIHHVSSILSGGSIGVWHSPATGCKSLVTGVSIGALANAKDELWHQADTYQQRCCLATFASNTSRSPSDAPDLPSLARLIKRYTQYWAAKRQWGDCAAAFSRAAQLCDRPAEHLLIRGPLRELAAAFKPLVPQLHDPAAAVQLLRALTRAHAHAVPHCAGELAEALVGRLGEQRGALLKQLRDGLSNKSGKAAWREDRDRDRYKDRRSATSSGGATSSG